MARWIFTIVTAAFLTCTFDLDQRGYAGTVRYDSCWTNVDVVNATAFTATMTDGTVTSFTGTLAAGNPCMRPAGVTYGNLFMGKSAGGTFLFAETFPAGTVVSPLSSGMAPAMILSTIGTGSKFDL